LNEKDLFPDYEPKKTPDTVYDYLRNSNSFVLKILEEIAKPSLNKLKIIINYFNKYKIVAEKNPGSC
jgi:hypothetical protein